MASVCPWKAKKDSQFCSVVSSLTCPVAAQEEKVPHAKSVDTFTEVCSTVKSSPLPGSTRCSKPRTLTKSL